MIRDTAQLFTKTTITNMKMIDIEMYNTNEYIILNNIISTTINIIAAIAAFSLHSLYILVIGACCLRIFSCGCSGLRAQLIVACILFLDRDNCCVVLLGGLLHFLLLIRDITLRLCYAIC